MGNPYYSPSYNPYPPPVLIGTAILFIIVPVVAVSLRFYARLSTANRLGADDWLALLALIFCLGIATVQIIATKDGGLGAHQQPDENGVLGPTPQLYVYEATRYAYEVLGAAGLCIIKLSVLFFFRRIFSVPAFLVVNNIVIGLTAAWGIAYVFALAFQCTPVSTLWNKLESEYGDSCVNFLSLYLSFAYTDLILDVVIFLLPVRPLWRLNLPIRYKLAVASVFFLGSLIIAIGVTRTIIYTWVVDFANDRPLLPANDHSWYFSGTLFWHLVENGVAVLCACMPSFAPLFRGKLGGAKNKDAGAAAIPRSPYHRGMTAPVSPYYKHIEDHILLHRPGSNINSNLNLDELAPRPALLSNRTNGERLDEESYHATLHAL